MPKVRLSVLLIGFSLGMVVVAIAFVGAGGVAMLEKVAGERTFEDVRIASATVRDAIVSHGDQLAASARLLGERPALRRVLSDRDKGAVAAWLEVSRQASGLPACAVFSGGEVLAAAGEPMPWRAILERGAPKTRWFAFAEEGLPNLVIAARWPVDRAAGAEVAVALPLNEAFARAASGEAGVLVIVIGRERIESEASGARGSLRLRALESEEPVAGRVDEAEPYVAAASIREPGGRVIGIAEARASAGKIDPSVRRLIRDLVLLALLVGVLAVGFSLLVARRIARPVGALTESSIRIGRGDFRSPVPRVGGVEMGTLAAAMEEMREQVLKLTTDLRMRRAEAEAILTGIVEGVYAVDRERRIRYMNPQAARLLGIVAGDTLGRFCGDVLNPRALNGVRPCEASCPILHARFRGKAHATEFLEPCTGGGRSVVITSAPSGMELEGTAAGALQYQVIRDETEVEATRRLRDLVLANISHEFRTPLSAQLASLELLRDKLPDLRPEEVRGLVLSIERGTLRLTRLIDNLLESTRIEAGHDSIRMQTCALDEIVEEAVELMVPLIEQREQTVEVRLPYPLPSIRGDATRLVQVFVNLLANANKFSPSGSTILLGGEVRETEIRLWVEDQGPGLPAGTVDALFERFMRSPDEEPEPRGMGLGLYIVKSIVERHGGRVEAESSESGTRMGVVLPRREEHEDPGGR